MRKDNKYNHVGPSAEDRALEKFAEMMIEKISTLQSDWKKPWLRRVLSHGQRTSQAESTMA